MFKTTASKNQSLNTLNKLSKRLDRDKPKKSRKQPQHSKSSKKDLKLIKHELITLKQKQGTLKPEHQKYLNKLVKKNKLAINYDNDDEYNDEIEQLQKEILNFKKEVKPKKKQFIENKLTPGLAPVDYDSEDE